MSGALFDTPGACSTPGGDDAVIAVLFVCLGNICRSPLAEGVLLSRIDARGVAPRFRVDSAGTGGWHAGAAPDHRMCRTAERHGIVLTSVARQIIQADFHRFDHIVCMDRENLANVLAIGAPTEKVTLLLHDHAVPDVPDPYYGDDAGFDEVYQLVDGACEQLLDGLLEAHA